MGQVPECSSGVISASYREDRTESFLYPEGAAEASDDAAFLSVARDVAIARVGASTSERDGRFSLPQPVGMPLGYNFSTLLKERDTVVQSAKNYGQLFRMLERGRVNSIVVMSDVAKIYLRDPQYAGRLQVLQTELHETAYYLMFARKGDVTEKLASAVWQQLKAINDNSDKLAQITALAEQQLQQYLSKEMPASETP